MLLKSYGLGTQLDLIRSFLGDGTMLRSKLAETRVSLPYDQAQT